jgi:hypothetical protein
MSLSIGPFLGEVINGNPGAFTEESNGYGPSDARLNTSHMGFQTFELSGALISPFMLSHTFPGHASSVNEAALYHCPCLYYVLKLAMQ